LIIAEVLAFVPVAWYIAIRLVFVNLAVFDGFGPIEAIRESWRISQRSVLRLLGWGLMAFLLGLGFVIVGGLASSPFSATGLAAVGQAASAAVTTTGSCLVVFLMAVLYESQRARSDPTLYGPPPVPAPVWGNQWPGYPNAGQWAPPAPTFQTPAPGPTASPGGQALPPDKPGDGEPPAQP
jgi:hypothetical protein